VLLPAANRVFAQPVEPKEQLPSPLPRGRLGPLLRRMTPKPIDRMIFRPGSRAGEGVPVAGIALLWQNSCVIPRSLRTTKSMSRSHLPGDVGRSRNVPWDAAEGDGGRTT